jgi:hypothetical protein
MTTVVLSCLHTLSFRSPNHAPTKGDVAWCPRCAGYRKAAQAPHNYVVNCEHCGRLRHHELGDAPIRAETLAIRHSIRYAGHRVTVKSGGELVSSYHHPVMEMESPPF